MNRCITVVNDKIITSLLKYETAETCNWPIKWHLYQISNSVRFFSNRDTGICYDNIERASVSSCETLSKPALYFRFFFTKAQKMRLGCLQNRKNCALNSISGNNTNDFYLISYMKPYFWDRYFTTKTMLATTLTARIHNMPDVGIDLTTLVINGPVFSAF